MQFTDLAQPSYVEAALIVGGLIAVMSGIVGRNKKSMIDEVLLFFGFIIGIVLLVVGVSTISNPKYPTSGVATALLLIMGIAMFFRPLKKVPFAGIIGFVGGLLTAIALYNMHVDTVLIIIAFVIVFLILWFIFKIIFGVIKMASTVLTFRPVLIILGVLCVIEGILLMGGSTL
jgi:hypothetical protein